MLTPTELKNKQFSKAMFGGYAMSEVDGLLDRLTPDYEAVYNENAELRKKVEVLLARIETYQEQEDSIKAAILNAQRMCDNIVAQAKQQAILIEQDAKARAEKAEEEVERSIADKRSEYEAICKEVTDFRNGLVEMYRAHLDKIREIPAFAPPEEEPPQTEDAGDAGEQPPAADASALEQEPESPVQQAVAASAAAVGVDMESLERRIAQQFSDLEKTMEFTLPSQLTEGVADPPAAPLAEPEPYQLEEPIQAAEPAQPAEPVEVVEILDDGAAPAHLPFPEEEPEDYSGPLSINMEDSLQFGEEFDVATGKKNQHAPDLD